MTRTVRNPEVSTIGLEPDALAAFYRAHVDALLAYLRYRCRDTELAADLCSEVFAAAALSAHRFRPGTSPRGWLFGIANHKLADSARRGAVDRRARERLGVPRITADDAELQDLDARLDARAEGGLLLALLDDLPAGEQTAVRAIVLADEPIADFARRVQIGEPAARQRLRRGLRRLATIHRESQP
jgi:RNA polymerase sigma factor (sigma-70 family)